MKPHHRLRHILRTCQTTTGSVTRCGRILYVNQVLGQVLSLIVAAALLIVSIESLSAQMIVAHRGASAAAPENTLASFKLAWELGADAIEGDFYLTADGQIVTIHDDNTKRTAGKDLKVAHSTLKELKRLDVGAWKSPKFRGERIPTIEEVLAVVPEGKKILIEIKCGPEIVSRLKKALDQTSLEPAQTIVIAFDEAVVRAVKRQIPTIKVYWLVGYRQNKVTRRWKPTIKEVLAALQRTGADGLDTQANQTIVNAEFVRAIRDAGYELHTWTIDDPKVARHFQHLGIDSITTNRPKLIQTQLTAPVTQ